MEFKNSCEYEPRNYKSHGNKNTNKVVQNKKEKGKQGINQTNAKRSHKQQK